MNASFEWLKDFTEFDLTPQELRDVITARAATVDDVVALRQDLADIVVGQVVSAAPHPDSDHLWITRVDAGAADLLDVVCGAPNVEEGMKYPFAPVGAVLPSGLRIERRKIRGQSSTGMLCSARELGLGLDHDGILALHTEAAPGTPFLAAYAAGDTRLVIDVLPNRADLLSHEGVAREIAAFTGNALRRPMPEGMVVSDAAPFTRAPNSATAASVRVSVDEAAECPLYIAIVIRGVRIGPSPGWLVSRLAGAGVRSINNVVDVTNYMLHGFGQPMHAFDLGRLDGPEIHVRRAHGGESITTLDGVARKLNASMTVIADAARAQAIAGVIGGQGSEVTETTTDILLETAIFDPRSVRRTRRALGVSTDASYRFERAMDAAAADGLARHAAALVCTLAGGEVDACILIGAPPGPAAPVGLRLSRVAQVLGEPVAATECGALLASVGFDVSAASGDRVQVVPPTWRADVTAEADLMEEIARLRGYDSFPDALRPFRVGDAADSPAYTVVRRVTRALVQAGLYEVRPTPFVADAGAEGVNVSNPLAASEAMLRSSLLQTLARRVEYNFAHMSRNVRLFEVGVAFTRGEGSLPVERTLAAAVITGDRFPAHFADPKPPHADLWDARQIAEDLVRAAYGAAGADFDPNATGDGWTVSWGGATIGSVGLLAVDAPAWSSPVFGVQIDVTPAMAIIREERTYVPLPSTPAAEFDLALLLPPGVLAGDVRRVITGSAGELLESLVPFDEFAGRGVPEGYRSVAWHLVFRHHERTLRDKEIEGRRGRILRALEEELGVRPRTT